MFEIRPVTEDDYPVLAEVFLIARRHAFPWCDPLSFELDDFTVQTNGEVIFLAENRDQKVLGFVSVWEPERFIHHLFVDPRHHRQGVGSALLASLSRWLPTPWRLKCKTANHPALAFYETQNWRELSRANDSTGEYALMEYGGVGTPHSDKTMSPKLDWSNQSFDSSFQRPG